MCTWKGLDVTNSFNGELFGTITAYIGHMHSIAQNSLTELLPCSSLNPFIGTLDVPVTNCSSLARVSLSNVSTALSKQNSH